MRITVNGLIGEAAIAQPSEAVITLRRPDGSVLQFAGEVTLWGADDENQVVADVRVTDTPHVQRRHSPRPGHDR